MATSGSASGRPASRCRGGNQKPNIVGATNAATSSCAPSAAAQRPAASREPRASGTASRQPLAVRAPQPPEPREGEHEHRRPAQQPVLAVDEQRDQPVGALEVAARKVRVGGALAGRVGGVRRRAAVERLVEGHVERHGEQRQLDGPHRQGPARRPPERARRHRADHHARPARTWCRATAARRAARSRGTPPPGRPAHAGAAPAAPRPRAPRPRPAPGRRRCRRPGTGG